MSSQRAHAFKNFTASLEFDRDPKMNIGLAIAMNHVDLSSITQDAPSAGDTLATRWQETGQAITDAIAFSQEFGIALKRRNYNCTHSIVPSQSQFTVTQIAELHYDKPADKNKDIEADAAAAFDEAVASFDKKVKAQALTRILNKTHGR
jgi:hypothetical protein